MDKVKVAHDKSLFIETGFSDFKFIDLMNKPAV